MTGVNRATVVIMAMLMAGCATHEFTHTVNVRVQTVTGFPIKGAHVTVNSHTHTTNKLGVAKQWKLPDADLWIVTYADGYGTQTARFPKKQSCIVNGFIVDEPCTGSVATSLVVLMAVKPTPPVKVQSKKEKK